MQQPQDKAIRKPRQKLTEAHALQVRRAALDIDLGQGVEAPDGLCDVSHNWMLKHPGQPASRDAISSKGCAAKEAACTDPGGNLAGARSKKPHAQLQQGGLPSTQLSAVLIAAFRLAPASHAAGTCKQVQNCLLPFVKRSKRPSSTCLRALSWLVGTGNTRVEQFCCSSGRALVVFSSTTMSPVLGSGSPKPGKSSSSRMMAALTACASASSGCLQHACLTH